MEKTGRLLRVLRAYFGLSRAEMARRVGVSSGTLSNIELGYYHPRRKTLEQIANGLGFRDADDLLRWLDKLDRLFETLPASEQKKNLSPLTRG
ncbi:MAG: helix-turn-helix transcriptional regulator [Candidatus Caldarchaeum sp.]